jgi:hypothetical protein
MDGGFFFIFILFVLLMIALAIYGWYAAAKRQQELAAWAKRHGMRFNPDSVYHMDDRFPEFGCLSQGSNRYAYNVLEGEWAGRPFLGFDYHYETRSTNSKGQSQTHHHDFSAVILTSDIPLKPLTICPAGFFDRVAAFFGYDDINFESAEFSRRFHVKAPDRKWAYDVFHARTIEFLLEQPTFSLQFDRRSVIAHNGSTFSLGEFEAAAELIRGVLDRLPEYVIQQQRLERS